MLVQPDTFDLAVVCLTVAVVVSMLCKAGKQFVWWLLTAFVLFVLVRVLSGVPNWGIVSDQTLTEVLHTVESTGVHETIKQSTILARYWSAVAEVRSYVGIAVPEPDPEPSGWLPRLL